MTPEEIERQEQQRKRDEATESERKRDESADLLRKLQEASDNRRKREEAIEIGRRQQEVAEHQQTQRDIAEVSRREKEIADAERKQKEFEQQRLKQDEMLSVKLASELAKQELGSILSRKEEALRTMERFDSTKALRDFAQQQSNIVQKNIGAMRISELLGSTSKMEELVRKEAERLERDKRQMEKLMGTKSHLEESASQQHKWAEESRMFAERMKSHSKQKFLDAPLLEPAPAIENHFKEWQEAERIREESNMASGYCQRLEEAIATFDSELDQSEEVALRLVSFGQTITFHVETIGHQNPGLIIFYGKHEGSPVTLVQNVSQISFLLTSVKRKDPSSPKIPFGFHAAVVREFTDKATIEGMNWDDSSNCWTDKDGNHFEKDGTPVKLKD